MTTTDARPRKLRVQAREHAKAARDAMDAKRGEAGDGLAGWIAARAAEWDLSGQDEATMQRQKFLWNALVDYWFRMEMDGWENLPESPVLMIGIHSGAPFVWDAWTIAVQWWRPFGPARPVPRTAHDALLALPGIGAYFRKMGALPASADSISAALAAG